jgi:hypothetical protein
VVSVAREVREMREPERGRAAELEGTAAERKPDRQGVGVTMPISDNVNDPEYWRKRAEDARTKAEETSNPEAQERLLRNAKSTTGSPTWPKSGD